MATSDLVVDSLSHQPTKYWNKQQVKQTVDRVPLQDPSLPIFPDMVRFVCMSDTHNQTRNIQWKLPPGDVFLHAGDFSMDGKIPQVVEFGEFLDSLPYKHKIVIAGNHDMSFDPEFLQGRNEFSFPQPDVFLKGLKDQSVEKASELISNKCIYLEDSGVSLFGRNIWGSPWQPWFHGWGFNLKRGHPCLEKWNLIPDDTDILITHGPPVGYGDMCFDSQRAGCVELLSTVQQRVRPFAHVFGHIHEGYGITTDGHTKYINASTCNLRYKPINPAIVFDVPLPEGHTKDEDPKVFFKK